MSDDRPIVPCPVEQRGQQRRVLFLRLADAFEQLRACERHAREIGEDEIARSTGAVIGVTATIVSDFEQRIRKELGA